jgi:hypothetical protein
MTSPAPSPLRDRYQCQFYFQPRHRQPRNQSYNGAPDLNWYRDCPGTDPQAQVQLYLPKLKNLQVDFVWAIPFKVQPLMKAAANTGKEARPARKGEASTRHDNLYGHVCLAVSRLEIRITSTIV